MKLIGERQLQARLKAIGQTELLMRDVTIHGVAEAKLLVPIKTSNLQHTIRPGAWSKDRAEIKAGGTAKVGYAKGIEIGTGIYGPHGKRIVPKKAKVLAWRTGGGAAVRLSGSSRVRSGKQLAGWAFARSVKGRKATPYLRPGLQKAATEFGLGAIVKLWNGAA